jgi:hypothetical protein
MQYIFIQFSAQIAHNRTVYAFLSCRTNWAVAARGFVRLGHSATLHSHANLHPQFIGPGNATHFSIRAAKPSQTAGTLGEIGLDIMVIMVV